LRPWARLRRLLDPGEHLLAERHSGDLDHIERHGGAVVFDGNEWKAFSAIACKISM
jgi:hypothetical protein